jgi:ribonucleotide reductase beta subunit family protein with ferritin-like domain
MSTNEKKVSFLTDKKNNRIMYFPVKYPRINKLYEECEKSFWLHNDIDPEKDLDDWKYLTKEEKTYTKKILSFFAASDIIVNNYIKVNFLDIIEIPEALSCLTYNMAVECIHTKVYTKIINIYCGTDRKELENILSDIKNIKAINSKINWIKKWIGKYDNNNAKEPMNLALLLTAAMCTEGIFFSSSFLAIYWLCAGGKNKSNKGQLKELSSSNVLISRDEGNHARFWILLIVMIIEKDFNNNEKKEYYEKAKKIIKEAVNVEKEFLEECLKVEFLGMKKSMGKEYIEYITDCLVERIGMKIIYNTKNPFPMMDLLNLKKKENFFEVKALGYQKAIIHKNTFKIKEKF